jgi:hypothetical protein
MQGNKGLSFKKLAFRFIGVQKNRKNKGKTVPCSLLRVPYPGQAASTITEDGAAASEAVAKSIDKLWNDVLSGGLYSAIANLGIFFAVGTLLIFIVQWTKEMIDGDSSKGFTELIWTIIVIALLARNDN